MKELNGDWGLISPQHKYVQCMAHEYIYLYKIYVYTYSNTKYLLTWFRKRITKKRTRATRALGIQVGML